MKQIFSPVFETYLVANGTPIETEAHVQRMEGITGVDSTQFLHELAAKLPGYYRLRIDCAPPGTLSYDATPLGTPGIFDGRIDSFGLATRQFDGEMRHAGRGGFKLSDRRILEELESDASPDIPLMVDDAKNMLETSRQNIFIVEGDTILTPPTDGRILPGITRNIVLSLAKQAGIKHAEEVITQERAKASDGLFMTNALSGISWANRWDAQEWPQPPELLRTLHQLLRERWEQQLA